MDIAHTTRRNQMPLEMPELDKLFCVEARKYRLAKGKLLLKAIATCESSLQERAYRFEPALFQIMKGQDPYWADKDAAIVSASYGYMQILFTTAWSMGMRPDNWKTMTHQDFQAFAEKLYDPPVNIDLGAKLIRQNLDGVYATQACGCFRVTPIGVALARYNGGSRGNPDENGDLRNFKYVSKVFMFWDRLKLAEKECDDEVA
jgi:soluble lytic murein transglycosylase-like protein